MQLEEVPFDLSWLDRHVSSSQCSGKPTEGWAGGMHSQFTSTTRYSSRPIAFLFGGSACEIEIECK